MKKVIILIVFLMASGCILAQQRRIIMVPKNESTVVTPDTQKETTVHSETNVTDVTNDKPHVLLRRAGHPQGSVYRPMRFQVASENKDATDKEKTEAPK